MKNTILRILVLITFLSCKHQNDTRDVGTIQDEKKMFIEVDSLYGKTLEYNYGDHVYEVNFISENELYWKCIKGSEKGKDATDKYSALRLDNSTLFVSWVEKDGLGVSQVIDLQNNTVKTFLKMNKEIVPLIGTIRKL